MFKVAISGNIASGKSTVEDLLSKMGFKVFDTDKISHEILEFSTEVRNAFKNYDILSNGKIDRKKLGNIVFSDSAKLKILESILHPLVKNKLIEIFNKNYDIVFISVPQLFESGFDELFDDIIYVTADKSVRLKRLMQRNNYSKEEADKRINAQIADKYKKQKANYIVYNNSTIDKLKINLDCIINDLKTKY